MEEELKKYLAEALQRIKVAESEDALEKLRVEYLGRKGRVSLLLRQVKDLTI